MKSNACTSVYNKFSKPCEGFQIWMPENQLCGALNVMEPHPLNRLNFKSWCSSWDMKFPFEVVSELDLIRPQEAPAEPCPGDSRFERQILA